MEDNRNKKAQSQGLSESTFRNTPFWFLEIVDHNTDKQPVAKGVFTLARNWDETKMSGKYFGGVSVHSSGYVRRPHLIDPILPFITQEDVLSPGFASSYPGQHVQAYNDIATKLSGAAGKIYIEMCFCTGLEDYSTTQVQHRADPFSQNHPISSLSGFWIEGSRFVTCAHFLDLYSITETQKQNTEVYLKAYSGIGLAKAAVVSDMKVPVDWKNATNAVRVYLSKLDRDNDLAIFQAYDDGCTGLPQGQTVPVGIPRTEIATLGQCDRSQGAYTIGYYTEDTQLQNLTSFDSQVLATFWPNDDGTRPKTYFPVKCAGAMQKHNNSLQFGNVFRYPDHRTISVGNVSEVLATREQSTLVLCEISAWFQNSGGMVGGFRRCQVDGRAKLVPAVFGVFRGDEGAKNVIIAFTAAGIDWLFN